MVNNGIMVVPIYLYSVNHWYIWKGTWIGATVAANPWNLKSLGAEGLKGWMGCAWRLALRIAKLKWWMWHCDIVTWTWMTYDDIGWLCKFNILKIKSFHQCSPNVHWSIFCGRTSFQCAPGELVPAPWKAPEVALSVVVPAYNEDAVFGESTNAGQFGKTTDATWWYLLIYWRFIFVNCFSDHFEIF